MVVSLLGSLFRRICRYVHILILLVSDFFVFYYVLLTFNNIIYNEIIFWFLNGVSMLGCFCFGSWLIFYFTYMFMRHQLSLIQTSPLQTLLLHLTISSQCSFRVRRSSSFYRHRSWGLSERMSCVVVWIV